MKNLDLNVLGVMEMDSVEIREVNGGNFAAALVLALAYDIVSNWSDSCAAFSSGVKAAQS